MVEQPKWTQIRSVTVDLIHGGGQLRAYGYHIWEAYLEFSTPEGQAWCSKAFTTDMEVIPYIPLFVHHFVPDDPAGGADNYYAPKLKKLEQVSPRRWYVLITSPYID